ncbi:hypothetical protein PUN28_010367 [Cardiocondyla obscurior]|uniref:Uncharacterized protein n=1 Tax=Cardiocondyla obscurior TaxID=286306 RepID=A0AAW2FNY5_9HYME
MGGLRAAGGSHPPGQEECAVGEFELAANRVHSLFASKGLGMLFKLRPGKRQNSATASRLSNKVPYVEILHQIAAIPWTPLSFFYFAERKYNGK